MGTYDTGGGTPRHDPAFDDTSEESLIECLRRLAPLVGDGDARDAMIDAANEIEALEEQRKVMRAGLREVETICAESAGACRKRMGTRVGNALVAARDAINKAEGR